MVKDQTPKCPSLRERNRNRTRRALVDAAYQLLQDVGYESLTVDSIADKAGVSRRTFFNYFPSLDDVLSSHVEMMLDSAVEAVVNAPESEGVLGLSRLALDRIISEDSLTEVAYLHYRAETSPQLRASGLLVWERARRRVTELFTQRFPLSDDLTSAVLVEAVLGAFYAAFNVWGSGLKSEPTPEDLDELVSLLYRALEIIQSPSELERHVTQPTETRSL